MEFKIFIFRGRYDSGEIIVARSKEEAMESISPELIDSNHTPESIREIDLTHNHVETFWGDV